MIPFYKYQGAGNDFVMIDNRSYAYLNRDDTDKIQWLCNRRFGIGADGLILIEKHPSYDFEMIYFNADGAEGSMCGNGGRCAVAFAKSLGIIDSQTTFLAIDGPHKALINPAGNWVELKMIDVDTVQIDSKDYVLNTGSPHYITFVDTLDTVNVNVEGQKIRYSETYAEQGINVNFVEAKEDGFDIATYERGVENETLACGTGVTAAAIAYAMKFPHKANQQINNGGIPVSAKGGQLSVRFAMKDQYFSDIWLCGPAEQVFRGEVEVV